MNRIIRRIAVALAFYGCFTLSFGCSMFSAQVTDRKDVTDAVAACWAFFGRTDAPPKVRIVTDLTCTDPNSGQRGFMCGGQCRGGCTLLPTEISVTDNGAPLGQQGLVCHELGHALLIREGLEGLKDRNTAPGIEVLRDAQHTNAIWRKPGNCLSSDARCGLVARANAALVLSAQP